MNRVVFVILLILCLAIAVGLRVVDLTADLPPYFAGGTQDFTTDSAYLTMYARSAVLFGTWNLYGVERWTEFRITLLSGVSYVVFELLGPSRFTSALAGATLHLAGLALFVAGLLKTLRKATVLFIAALLATNYVLVLYGRMAFAENAMLFLAGVIFCIYQYWFEKPWGKLMVGVAIAACGLFGKSFGFLLIGAAIMHLVRRRDRQSARDIALVVIPVLVITILYALLIHSESGLFGFLYEHGVGEHGAPHGFASIRGFFETLISFGREGLYKYTPALSVLACFAVILLIVSNRRQSQSERTLDFMVGWWLTWVVALFALNYQPVRYLYVLVIPMTVVVGIVAERLTSEGLRIDRHWTWWRVPAMLAVVWSASFAVVQSLSVGLMTVSMLQRNIWNALLPAVGACAVILFCWRRLPGVLRVRNLGLVLIPSLVIVMAGDTWQFGNWFLRRSHLIEEAARDVADILGPGAVVAGQAGPVLTADGESGSLRLFLRDNLTEFSSQIGRYPVTHIAVGSASWDAHVKRLPELGTTPVMANFWLRDIAVKLIPVWASSRDNRALAYTPSEYELANQARVAGDNQRARTLLESFIREHPGNKTALLEHYHMTVSDRTLAEARPEIERLVRLFPTDYLVAIEAAIYFRGLASATNDPAAVALRDKYYREAIWRAAIADRLRDWVERIYQQDTPEMQPLK